MNFYIDAHCHIDLIKNIQFNSSAEDALPIKSISVTNAPFIYKASKTLFEKAQNIRVALGMHPELVYQYGSQLDLFRKLIADTKYIGEIGLDGSLRFKESFDLQKKVFVEIIKICKNKVLTIHTRNASSETIESLDKYLKSSSCKIIFHWYSGNQNDLLEAIKRGYYFSINHRMVATEKGKEVIRRIPNSQLLTETDAPFTFDGIIKTRLQSLKKTIETLSLIKGIETLQLQEIIYENFKSMLKAINQ